MREEEREKGKEEAWEAVKQLGRFLGMARPPERIEAFDISDIAGHEAVGSLVLFTHGEAQPDRYRRFRIKRAHFRDDYDMMREVVSRRFRRLQEEGGDYPDLVLIDGGKGHLAAALGRLRAINLTGVPVIGLAKREEQIFQEGKKEPLRLPPGHKALYLIERVRDEAHRFALTFHRRLREKAMRVSLLDEVPGIGEKRKRSLLSRFSSLAELRETPAAEIARAGKIPRRVAEELKEMLRARESQGGVK